MEGTIYIDRDQDPYQRGVGAAGLLDENGATLRAVSTDEAVEIKLALAPDRNNIAGAISAESPIRVRSRPIGIITADSDNLKLTFRNHAGLATPDYPLVIRGLQDQPAFRGAVFGEKGTLDAGQIEAVVVSVALDRQQANPAMGRFCLNTQRCRPM